MACGSPNHNRLINHVNNQIYNHLKGKKGGCDPFSSDQMVSVGEGLHQFYPDVSVACKPFIFSEDTPKALKNFSLIIEVLSPSTMRYDLMGKSAA